MQSPSTSPFASVMGLGAMEAEHRVSNQHRWSNLIVAVICLALAPACMLLTFFIYQEVAAAGGQAAVWEQAVTVFWPLGAAALAGLGGLWLLYTTWRGWGAAVAIFQQGLAYADRSGLQQLRWEDVQGLGQRVVRQMRSGRHVGTTHLFTVKTATGQELRFDDRYTEIAKLGQALQQRVSNALFPRYATAFNNGERVTFGPLAFDREQIYHGNRALTWSEVQSVRVANGWITVNKAGAKSAWASVGVDSLPNFVIFYELVGRLTKVE